MDTKLTGTDRPIAIYFAFPYDIDAISDVNVNTKRVTFKAGKDWKLINTTIGSIDFQEKPAKTVAGTIYNTSVSASSPGHEQNTPSDISELSGNKALLRVDFRKGLKKLVGSGNIMPLVFIDVISNHSTARKIRSEFKQISPSYWLE